MPGNQPVGLALAINCLRYFIDAGTETAGRQLLYQLYHGSQVLRAAHGFLIVADDGVTRRKIALGFSASASAVRLQITFNRLNVMID